MQIKTKNLAKTSKACEKFGKNLPNIANENTEMCCLMEHHNFKNVNNSLNTNIYSFLETSGGKRVIIYNKMLFIFSTSVLNID